MRGGRGGAARDVTSGLDSPDACDAPDPPAERTDTADADDDATDDLERALWKCKEQIF